MRIREERHSANTNVGNPSTPRLTPQAMAHASPSTVDILRVLNSIQADAMMHWETLADLEETGESRYSAELATNWLDRSRQDVLLALKQAGVQNFKRVEVAVDDKAPIEDVVSLGKAAVLEERPPEKHAAEDKVPTRLILDRLREIRKCGRKHEAVMEDEEASAFEKQLARERLCRVRQDVKIALDQASITASDQLKEAISHERRIDEIVQRAKAEVCSLRGEGGK